MARDGWTGLHSRAPSSRPEVLIMTCSSIQPIVRRWSRRQPGRSIWCSSPTSWLKLTRRSLPAAGGRKVESRGIPRLGVLLIMQEARSRPCLEDLRPFIDSYDVPLANSEFTAAWVEKRWARKADVLPPPIDTERFAGIELDGKKRVILSVGRFLPVGITKSTWNSLVPSGVCATLAWCQRGGSTTSRAVYMRIQPPIESTLSG